MGNRISTIAESLMIRKGTTDSDIEQGFAPEFSPQDAAPHVDHYGRPQISPDDQLNLFRHLTGIISHPSMIHAHLREGGRVAPNLGIYARVVHNEQRSKKGYKRFSWLINSCLGLQIIVAAALTAMGAAGTNHSAVTVFGAINTVIAGVLTFLKGSGLPNRLRYYQTEWKWVREFIEQRERDFSRPGCSLDVHAVVEIVEKMYEEVKMDLEASEPDRFAGFRKGPKKDGGTNGETKFAPVSLPRIGNERLSEKLKEMESGFGSRVNHLVSDINQQSNTTQVAEGVARDIVSRTKTIGENTTNELKEYQKRAEHFSGDAVAGLQAQVDRITNIQDRAREIGEDFTNEIDEQSKRANQLGQDAKLNGGNVAKELGNEIERAQQIEKGLFEKLKDLRSEIGNRTHLAQEAMNFLQEAHHHHHDGNMTHKRTVDQEPL